MSKKDAFPDEEVVVYKYRLRSRLFLHFFYISAFCVMVFIIILTIISFVEILTGLEIDNWKGTETFIDVFRNFLFMALWGTFIFTLHLLFPAVAVRATGFRLVTLVYKSRWLDWDEIIAVNEHWQSRRRNRMIVIKTEHIDIFFALIGYTQGQGGTAFIIHSKLVDYNDLLCIFEQKRPDLFDGASETAR